MLRHPHLLRLGVRSAFKASTKIIAEARACDVTLATGNGCLVVRADVAGTAEPVLLTGVPASAPRFSRDGQSIYYSVITGPREKHDFWKLSSGDSKVSRVTKLEGRRGNIGDQFATDGRFLYFTWRKDDGDIWVMDVATDVRK